MRKILEIAADSRGAAAVEYSLIIGLVFLALMSGVVTLSDSVAGAWNEVAVEVEGAS